MAKRMEERVLCVTQRIVRIVMLMHSRMILQRHETRVSLVINVVRKRSRVQGRGDTIRRESEEKKPKQRLYHASEHLAKSSKCTAAL